MPRPLIWVRLLIKLSFCFFLFIFLILLTLEENVRREGLKSEHLIGPDRYLHIPPVLHLYEEISEEIAPELMSTFVLSLMGEMGVKEGIPEISYIDDAPLESVFHHVISTLSTSTRHCKKMVRVGGKYCDHETPDGYKMICLDHDTQPSLPPSNCLVYSFGIGHDFSFETAMARAGCSVYGFDLDYSHLKYPRVIAPGAFFLKVRIGVRSEIKVVTDRNGKFPYTYRTLPDIMTNLNHINSTIDVLKMDIEHDEWDLMEKSLFQTNILERTKQLALEVHLNKLRSDVPSTSKDEWIGGLRRYARVIRGLHKRGFRLSSFEPNYKAPVAQKRFDRIYYFFFETLWVNVKLQAGVRDFHTHTEHDLENFDSIDFHQIVRFQNRTLRKH